MGGERSAASAFALLSDETRVDVLRAVAYAQNEAEVPGGGMTALSFSEIYDRVGVDNTSKLSYHLGELTGTFLWKHDGGYSLTHAGEQMVRFILAENVGAPADFEPLQTEGTCLYCGGTDLEATLREQYVVVGCSDCNRPVAGYVVTPAQTRSRTDQELLESIKRRQATEYGLVQRGVCPECAGRIDTQILAASETPLPEGVPVSFLTVEECQQCLRMFGGPLTHGLAYHPASVAFHWDHGIDVMTSGIWKFNHFVREEDWTAERVATDPAAYEVLLRRGDDALRLSLDENAQVTRTERVRGQDVS